MIQNFYKKTSFKTGFLFLLVLFFCLTIFSVTSFAAEDFPTYGANFERTGFVDTGLFVDLNKPYAGKSATLWEGGTKIKFQGGVESTPLVVNDKIYVTTSQFIDGEKKEAGLYCYSFLNYSYNFSVKEWYPVKEWFYRLDEGSYSTPTYSDGSIYVGDSLGVLYRIDAATGKSLWAPDSMNIADYTKNYGLTSSPLVFNDKVYVTSKEMNQGGSGGLICLNAGDGMTIERFDADRPISFTASPCFGKNTIFAPGGSGIIAVSPETDKILWSFEVSADEKIGTPVYKNGNLYFETSKFLYSIKAENNVSGDRLNWKTERSGPVTSPALSKNYAVSIQETNITAYNLADGSVKWTKSQLSPTRDYRFSPNSPLIDGSTVYYTQNFYKKSMGPLFGVVCAVDLETGEYLKDDDGKELISYLIPEFNIDSFDYYKSHEVWKQDGGDSCPITYSSPVSVDGKVLVGTSHGLKKHSKHWCSKSLFLFGSQNSKISVQSDENAVLFPNEKINVTIFDSTNVELEVDQLSLLGMFERLSEKSIYNYNISKIGEDKYKISEFNGQPSNDTSKWTVSVNGVLIGPEFSNIDLKSKDVVDLSYESEKHITKISVTVLSDHTIEFEEIPVDSIRLISGKEREIKVNVKDPLGAECNLKDSDLRISFPSDDIVGTEFVKIDGKSAVFRFNAKKEGTITGFVEYLRGDSVAGVRRVEISVFDSDSIPSDPFIEETGDDFFTSRGNYARTGVAKGPGPKAPVLYWQHEFLESGYPTLVDGHSMIANGKVYVATWLSGKYPNGSSINGLNVFDKDTGEFLDKFEGSSRAGPTIYKGRIYTPSGTGLLCLDEKTGKKLWETGGIVFYPWAGLTSLPLVYDDVVYICANSKGQADFLGYNATTGNKLFTLDAGPGVSWFVAPSMSPGNDTYPHVVYCPGDGGVFAFDTKTRKKIWSFDAGARGPPDAGGNGRYISTPVYYKGHIYQACTGLAKDGGAVYSLNAITGEVVWKVPFGTGGPAPIVTEDRVYVKAEGGPAAFDRKTGKLIYGKETAHASPTAYPILADGIIYSANMAFDAESGKYLWSYDLPKIHPEQSWITILQGTPSLQDGVYYFGCENNIFYALKTPKYTVSYDTGVQKRINSAGSFNDGDSIILSNFTDVENKTAVKDWYDSETDLRVGSPGDEFIPVKDMTLYPKYEKAVNITYCPDGEAIMYLRKLYTPEQNPLLPGDTFKIPLFMPEPKPLVHYGKGFCGWTDGKNIYYSGRTHVVPDEGLNLSPVWDSGRFWIRYEFGYESVFLKSPCIFVQGRAASGSNIWIPDEFPEPNPEFGVAFAGWHDTKNLYMPGDMYEVGNSDVTFRAVWHESPSVVKYDLNGGLYENKPEAPSQKEVAPGMYTYIAPKVPIKSGFLFKGWSDGVSDKLYQPNEKYVVGEEDVTLTAQWSPGVTVTFDKRGGRVNMDFVVGLEGDPVLLPQSFATYKKDGVFKGWGLSPDTPFDEVLTEYKFPAQDTTLYAIWEGGIEEPTETPTPTASPTEVPTVQPDTYYSVRFELSGGIGADAPTQKPLKGGSVFIIPEMPEGVRLEGFEFSGWLNEVTGLVYQPGERYKMSYADTVFSAVWKAGEVVPTTAPESPFRSVSFVDSDGTLIVRRLVEPGDKIPKISQIPIKSGQLFNGWLLNGNLISEDTLVYENIVLYADYKEFPVLSGTSDKPSIIDVILLLQYVSGTGALSDIPPEDMVLIADFNKDGKTDLTDVLIFLKAI